MGKSTINSHFPLLFVCSPEGIHFSSLHSNQRSDDRPMPFTPGLRLKLLEHENIAQAGTWRQVSGVFNHSTWPMANWQCVKPCIPGEHQNSW